MSCKRERQSAIELSRPATCFTWTVNSKRAATRNSFLNRDIIFGHLDDWADKMFTTSKLSQWNRSRFPRNSGAYKKQAKYI